MIQPDVLLLDEVLAVGDAAFRVKCLNQVTNLLKTSAVIFVSHSETQIKRICTQAIVLSGGREKLKTNNVYEAFLTYNQPEVMKRHNEQREWISPKAEVLSCTISPDLEGGQKINSKDALIINIKARAKTSIGPCKILLLARANEGDVIAAYETHANENQGIIRENQIFDIKFEVQSLNLATGHYEFDFFILEKEDLQIVSKCTKFLLVYVICNSQTSAVVCMDAEGSIS